MIKRLFFNFTLKCVLVIAIRVYQPASQEFAPDLVLGDVVYACAMGQSELLGRAQGRSPPRLPRVLVHASGAGVDVVDSRRRLVRARHCLALVMQLGVRHGLSRGSGFRGCRRRGRATTHCLASAGFREFRGGLPNFNCKSYTQSQQGVTGLQVSAQPLLELLACCRGAAYQSSPPLRVSSLPTSPD